MPKKDRDIITKELGVEPILINASLVSAQSRKRLFWTNIPDVKQPEDKGIMLKDILLPDIASNAVDKTMTETPNAKSKGGLKKVGFVEKNLQGYRVYSTEGKATTLSSSGGGLGQSTGLYLIKGVSIRGRLKGLKYENHIDVRKDDKVSALTSTCSSKLALVGRMVNDNKKEIMVLDKDSIRRLTPIECERLMGLPDNYTDGVANSSRYRVIGNAFSVPVMKHILSFIKE